MKKQEDIDSILIANWYFTKCKMENPSGDRTELARKYLVTKIGKALIERAKITKPNAIKAFVFLPLFELMIK